MELSRSAAYRALETRDCRFDGRIFSAVRTTGVYCRPICPARTPNFENVEFFPSATEARLAGYRPCLRCRPERAPAPETEVRSGVVARAMALIGDGFLDEGGPRCVGSRA